MLPHIVKITRDEVGSLRHESITTVTIEHFKVSTIFRCDGCVTRYLTHQTAVTADKPDLVIDGEIIKKIEKFIMNEEMLHLSKTVNKKTWRRS